MLLAIEKRWPGPDARGHLGPEGTAAPPAAGSRSRSGSERGSPSAARYLRERRRLARRSLAALGLHCPLRSRLPAMLIDTHCHLADPAYDADRAAGARAGLGRRVSATSS